MVGTGRSRPCKTRNMLTRRRMGVDVIFQEIPALKAWSQDRLSRFFTLVTSSASEIGTNCCLSGLGRRRRVPDGGVGAFDEMFERLCGRYLRVQRSEKVHSIVKVRDAYRIADVLKVLMTEG